MKKLLVGFVLSLIVFAYPVFASEIHKDIPQSPFVVAYNSPSTRPLTAPTAKDNPNVLLGQRIALENGISGTEWECLYKLGMRESGWKNTATNKTSGAYGIGQFLDSTWAGTGYEKTSNPVTQIEAMIKYIENRYGTPCKGLEHSYKFNWY